MYTCWLYFMNWKLPSFNKRIQLQNKDCQDLTCYIYIKKTFLNILIDIIYNFAKNSYQPLTSQHMPLLIALEKWQWWSQNYFWQGYKSYFLKYFLWKL